MRTVLVVWHPVVSRASIGLEADRTWAPIAFCVSSGITIERCHIGETGAVDFARPRLEDGCTRQLQPVSRSHRTIIEDVLIARRRRAAERLHEMTRIGGHLV